MSMTKANAAVRRGVKLLDKVAPGWWKPSKISLRKLDMSEYLDDETGCGCIAGQLSTHGIAIRMNTEQGFLHDWDSARDRYITTYPELQTAWEREIRAKREAAKAKA